MELFAICKILRQFYNFMWRIDDRPFIGEILHPFLRKGCPDDIGCGNLIDRIAHGGCVTDFLNVGVGGLRTGIFNIADAAIVAGAFLMVLRSAKQEKTLNG